MPSLAAIASALIEAGLDLTAPEVVDVIWFAQHVGQTGHVPAESPSASTPADSLDLSQPSSQAATTPESDDLDDDLDDIDAEVEVSDPAGEERGAGLHLPSGGRGAGPGRRGGLGIRVAGVAPLPEALKLARALRPLMRRRPSRTSFMLDEVGTAESIVDMRVIVPQMRPAPVRWFELALIVDKSASMAVWQATIQEFRRLLERQGAFRDVRSWGMMTDFTDGVVRLYPGLGPIDPRRTPHKPSELVDTTGRRITLVVSDCVSAAWHNGTMAAVLAEWQRSGPLAIVQTLPAHLWDATGLIGAADADLTAALPGALNRQLRVSAQDPWHESQPSDLAVPILQLNPRSLRDWSALVMGSAQARVVGRVFHMPEASPAQTADAPPQSRDAEHVVGNFRALVSRQGWALAGVLATIPVLTLPLMRVVQSTLLPDSDVTHLAELFIGGILRERQENAHLLDSESVEYVFADGISDLLIRSISSYDAIAALSLFFEQHLGRPINFFALLEDPSNAVNQLGLDKESQSFAALTTGALRRLGGSFARVAEELDKAATDGGVSGFAGGAQPAAGARVSQKVTKRPPTDAERVGILVSRAEKLTVEGKYQSAEANYKRALEIAEKIWGSQNQQTARIMNQIAGVLQAQNKNDEAYQLYEKSFAVVSSLDSVDQLQLALMSNNFGTFLQSQERYAEAEQSFRRALEIRLSKLGPHNPLVAISQNNLAVLLGLLNRTNEAIGLFRQSLAILEDADGYEEVFRSTINNFARLLLDLQHYDEAVRLNRRFNAFLDRSLVSAIALEQRTSRQYADFEIFIGALENGAYNVRVRASNGYQAGDMLVLPTHDPRHTSFQVKIEYTPSMVTEEDVLDLGKVLHDTLFERRNVWGAFVSARDAAARDGKTLRMKWVIGSDQAAVASFPWELMCDDAGIPLVTEHSICRSMSRTLALPGLKISSDAKLKLLLTSALPRELAERYPLDIAAEATAIRTALKPLEDAGKLLIIDMPHLTASSLNQAIIDENPHILHYIGHGIFAEDIGSLVLEDSSGSRQDLSAPELASMLSQSSIRLVFLNASNTATVTTNMLGGIASSLNAVDIPAVIGWQSLVSDVSCLVFAEEFYRTLAAGEFIDHCVMKGRKAIIFSGASKADWGLATLYLRSSNGILFEGLDGTGDTFRKSSLQQTESFSSTHVNLGSGSHFAGGAITFGNVIGGNIIQSNSADANTISTSLNPSGSVTAPDRRRHLIEMRNIKKQELYDLELKEAKFGSLYVPTYLAAQLRDLRAELAQIEAELQQLGG